MKLYVLGVEQFVCFYEHFEAADQSFQCELFDR